MSLTNTRITPEQYQFIRPFVIHSLWNAICDEMEHNSTIDGNRNDNLLKAELKEKVHSLSDKFRQITHCPPYQFSVSRNIGDSVKETKPMSRLQQFFSRFQKPDFHLFQAPASTSLMPDSSYHDWYFNHTNINITNIVNALSIVCSVVHEGTHALQSCDNDKQQQQMTALYRALYIDESSHSESYMNNYLELDARCQEAQFLLNILPHAVKDDLWNIAERKNLVQQLAICHTKLLETVSQHNIKKLVTGMTHYLQHSSEDCPLFHDIFPGNTPRERNKTAAEFLKTQGLQIHLRLYDTAQAISAQLIESIQKLETEIQNQVHTSMVDDRRKTLTRLQERDIPFVNTSNPSQLPMRAYCLDGHDMNTVESILDTVQGQHNVCCALREGLLCVFYDDKEQTRPILKTSVNVEDVTHELSIVKEDTDKDAEYDKEER